MSGRATRLAPPGPGPVLNFARNSLVTVSRFEIASLESCGFEPWLETEQFKLRARLLGKVRIWLAVGLRIGYAHVGR